MFENPLKTRFAKNLIQQIKYTKLDDIDGVTKRTDKYSDIIKQGQKMSKHIEVKNKTSLPGKGEPNSSADLLNPGGTVKRRWYYDEYGKAKEDIDFNYSDDGTLFS